jgi:hypothetical protein
MEIQGVPVPYDVLGYIASFLWLNDDWGNFCSVFAKRGRVWHKPISIWPNCYFKSNDGLTRHIRRIRWIGEFTHGWFRSFDGLFTMGANIINGGDAIYRAADIYLRGVCGEVPSLIKEYDNSDPARRELSWIFKHLSWEFPRLYWRLNSKNIVTHKRTRKRVKR